MKKVHRLIIVMVFAMLGILVLRWILSSKITFDYDVTAQCKSMPDRDHELEKWLKGQPGVTNAVVARCNDGEELRIFFVMFQNMTAQDPPRPNLEPTMERLGYDGIISLDWRVRPFHFRE